MHLYPAVAGEKWGFIDRNGDFLISPKFDYAGFFHCDRAVVGINENFGYCDPKGEIQIQCAYTDCESFSCDRGVVSIGPAYDRRFSVLDPFGKIIVPYSVYSCVFPYSDKVSIVERDSVCGVIDTSGREVVSPQYRSLTYFYEGVASFSTTTGYGVLDASGQILIDPTYHFIGPFREGLAACKLTERSPFIFMDRLGNSVARPSDILETKRFSEGLCPARSTKGWGFINCKGDWVIEPDKRWFDVDEFSEGRARVFIEDKSDPGEKLIGFINELGRVVIDPKYEKATRFTYGLASCWIDGIQYYLNFDGSIAYEGL